ncbi:MAG TPA: hypothetical protein VGF45_23790 [Polyangia bacterium]
MSERMASLGVVAACLLAGGLALGVACSGDDEVTGERPETPAPMVDASAGSGDGGDQRGCPSSPPRVGETCSRTDVVDQICSYSLGSCTVGGSTYDNIEEYRCYEGTWHAWNIETNKCRTP